MTRLVNLYQAKTNLSRIVDEAAAGEEIIIAKAGKPWARLVPYSPAQPRRVPGAWEGKLWIAEDFDEPLPAEVLAAFAGEGGT